MTRFARCAAWGVPRSLLWIVLARPVAAWADRGGGHDALDTWTRQLVDMIAAPTLAPHVTLIALFAAVVLGALHAFSPGHGKTIVGAYLIGSRSTPRHAVFLGLTVTITHTLVVFALGLATLVASRFIVPERLLPALSLLSGLLVLGMGLMLLMQRWQPARNALAGIVVRRVEAARDARDAPTASGSMPYRKISASATGRVGMRGVIGHAAGQGRRHDHPHDHGHPRGSTHAHGGSSHSHLPPGATGETVTWRGLLALGVSGGLVPCPSAMVLLLAAVALNKTLFGLILVVAFSVGLALTLIAVGMLFLYARSRFRSFGAASVWPQVLPVVSALLITAIGILLCYGALTSVGAGVQGH